MRAQCFASDVTYNYDVLKNWDEDKVREFFENGGGGEGAAPSTKVLDIADAKDGVQTDPYAASMPDECLCVALGRAPAVRSNRLGLDTSAAPECHCQPRMRWTTAHQTRSVGFTGQPRGTLQSRFRGRRAALH